MKKICRKCRIEKEIGFFHKAKINKDGYRNICFECRRFEYIKPKAYVEESYQRRKERFRQYGLANKGKKKSSETIKKISESLKRIQSYKFPPGFAAMNRTYHRYRARGLKWEREEFKLFTQQNCFYCGSPPNNTEKTSRNSGEYIYNGIDRINNNMGYDIENCVPCCKKCNQAKLAYSIEEFLDWIKKVYEHSFETTNT